jgi:hypothetical protein
MLQCGNMRLTAERHGFYDFAHIEDDLVAVLKFHQQGIIVIGRDLEYFIHRINPPLPIGGTFGAFAALCHPWHRGILPIPGNKQPPY